MNYISLKNNQTIPIASIPELDYTSFLEQNVFLFDERFPGSLCKLFWLILLEIKSNLSVVLPMMKAIRFIFLHLLWIIDQELFSFSKHNHCL